MARLIGGKLVAGSSVRKETKKPKTGSHLQTFRLSDIQTLIHRLPPLRRQPQHTVHLTVQIRVAEKGDAIGPADRARLDELPFRGEDFFHVARPAQVALRQVFGMLPKTGPSFMRVPQYKR